MRDNLFSLFAFLWTCLLACNFVNANPVSESVSLLEKRPDSGFSPLTVSQIVSFKPYTYYASAAYCPSDRVRNWTCGVDCDANPAFHPVAAGGDGGKVQYWYVGYDTALKVVIVSHQGTVPSEIMPVITDVKAKMIQLDDKHFPGLPPAIRVHDGFSKQQLMTAADVHLAVKRAIADSGFKTVAIVGHSLGGALALLDSIYLPIFVPDVAYSLITFGMPRVGNQALADYIDKNYLHLNVARITNKKDPVPTLPGRHDGFRHPQGEKHIQVDGAWLSCPGQDNEDSRCSIGSVPNIKAGNVTNHDGPYDGVMIGCRSTEPTSFVAQLATRKAEARQFSISVSFFSFFELVGSIGDGDDRRISVKLYANVPFYGRVTLASFTGALRIEGKDVSISVKIDVNVAKGVISVILEDKDLYLGLQLDILFAGHVATTFKLLTLPL